MRARVTALSMMSFSVSLLSLPGIFSNHGEVFKICVCQIYLYNYSSVYNLLYNLRYSRRESYAIMKAGVFILN